MEDSNSDTFNSNAPAQSSSSGHEDIVESFGSLAFETQERVHVVHAQPRTRFSDLWLMNRRVDTDTTRNSSRNLFSRGNSILESQDSTIYREGNQVPIQPRGLESFLVSSDHSNVAPNQYIRGHYGPFQEIGNGGYCLPGGYNWNNYGESSSGLLNQSVGDYGGLKSDNVQLGRDNVVVMATTPFGSFCLQKILELKNPEFTRMVLKRVYHSIVELMADDHGKDVFERLLEACHDNELNLIMVLLERKQARFVKAAFNANGSISVEGLIRKVKGTPHASTITRILSIRLPELMMHRIGMYAIRACLEHFGVEENEVLFNAAISYCIQLATNKMGCISLYACINSITGLRREMLLNRIADKSNYLANDPYGNFVVQHVLSLGHEETSSRICERLQGLYIYLSGERHGTHVVRKCIELSELGMTFAVKEILKTEKAALQLAMHLYGNHVIKSALKQTKIKHKSLYESLVKALRPYHADLMASTTGRNVLAIILNAPSIGQTMK